MPKLLTFIFFILISFLSFTQEGFKIIKQAEKKFTQKKYNKSLRLLEDAKNMNYGFCGNAWSEANYAIYSLRSKIYIELKQYQHARNCLDSIYMPKSVDNFDSIIIITYINEIGKDSLASMIDSSLLKTEIKSISQELCYIIIPLTDNVNILKFKVNEMMNYTFWKDKVGLKRKWLQNFRENYLLQLIKNKS